MTKHISTCWGLNGCQRWHFSDEGYARDWGNILWAQSPLCPTLTAITLVCVFVALPNASHDIRHFSVWSCDTPTTPGGPSFIQLLLPMWKPWQRPVGTSLWHIAFILCEVWGRVQVLLWEKMETRPQEPQTFQNGGRLLTTTQWLPVWLLSDHLLVHS